MGNRPAPFAVRQYSTQGKSRSLPGTISGSTVLTCLFGSFVFLQFTVLGLANHAGEGYLSGGQREMIYYALQIFVILGYLLYGLFARLCAGKRIRNTIANSVLGIFFVCVAVMLAAGSDSLCSVIVSMAAALCLGGIGGSVHYRMSLETVMGAHVARSMGLGSAAAVAMQYLSQIRWGVTPLLPVLMACAFFLLVFLLQGELLETAGKRDKNPGYTSPARLVSAILIAASFVLFVGFYNETVHHLMIESGYVSANVYSWPRLILIPGYLVFAVIGDRKNGKYVPITALCIMLLSLLNVVLTGDAGFYWLNMCLFYFAIAAFTSYYLLTFWRLAPGTENPALWAPFGRVIDSGMVLLTGAVRLSALPVPVVLGLDIAVVILVILLMAVGGDFNLTERLSDKEASAVSSAALPPAAEIIPEAVRVVDDERRKTVPVAAPSLLSPEEALARIQESCRLTQRETDVLRELVLTEDTQAVISARLSIQVKTLQSYVTKLYRKTGSSTRAGLTDLYHITRNQH